MHQPRLPTDHRLLRALQRLRRRVLLHRRPLAALLAAAAALVAVQAAAAPPPATVAVWTAAHDLPSGTVLARSDVRRTQLPPASVPPGALADLHDVLGRVVAQPAFSGEPLVADRFVGPGLLTGESDRVAVPLRLTDPGVAALLRVGDVVDLVAADPQGGGAEVVAPDVRVLAMPAPAGDSDGPADAVSSGRLVVFSVPPGRADTVASAAVSNVVTVQWSR